MKTTYGNENKCDGDEIKKKLSLFFRYYISEAYFVERLSIKSITGPASPASTYDLLAVIDANTHTYTAINIFSSLPSTG